MIIKCSSCYSTNIEYKGKLRSAHIEKGREHNIYYCNYCGCVKPIRVDEIEKYLNLRGIYEPEGYDFQPASSSLDDISHNINRVANELLDIKNNKLNNQWQEQSLLRAIESIATSVSNLEFLLREVKEEKKNNKFGLLSSSSFDLR